MISDLDRSLGSRYFTGEMISDLDRSLGSRYFD